MILQTFKKLFANDFKEEYRALISQLALSLNDGIVNLYTLSQNGINLRDNIAGKVADVNVLVDNNGIPTNITQIRLTSPLSRVDGIFVLNTTNTVDSTTYPPGAVYVNWIQSNNSTTNLVTINKVTGLTPNIQYSLHLMIFLFNNLPTIL